ncbi:unnamed protein product, partial [Symbiodinium pilosum]
AHRRIGSAAAFREYLRIPHRSGDPGKGAEQPKAFHAGPDAFRRDHPPCLRLGGGVSKS